MHSLNQTWGEDILSKSAHYVMYLDSACGVGHLYVDVHALRSYAHLLR